MALGGRSSYLGALGHPDPGAVAVQFDWNLSGIDGGICMTSLYAPVRTRWSGNSSL